MLLATAAPARGQVAEDPVDHPVAGQSASSGEAQVVADPSRPQTAVTAFLDFRGNPMIGVRRTTDGGREWKETGTFEPPNTDLWTADPSLAFAPDGTLFLGYLQGATREGTPRGGGLFVARSEDGGATWQTPVLAVPSLDQGVCSGPDKSMIAAGPGGRVHISYHDHTDGPEAGCDGDGPTIVRIASSSDGGRTFRAPVALTTAEEDTFGSMPRVLPDGTLLVSHLGFPGNGVAQYVERSFDDGRSFKRVHVADTVAPTTVAGGAPLAANAISSLSTDPDGRVAMAWVAGEPYRDDNHVEVHVSGDGGESWRALPPVAAGLPIALQQWLAHGPDGRLHLFFYGATPGGLYDAYLTSFDGRAWSPPARLSSASSSGAVGYGFGIGHYPGLDVGPDGLAYPVWSDARDRPAAFAFYLWTRSVVVGGARPFTPAPAAPAGPDGLQPQPAAPGPAPRLTVRRTRSGFSVRVDVGSQPRSLRVELRRASRRVARARLRLGTGVRTVRLRAPRRGRYVLRVAVIDDAGRTTVLRRRIRR